MFSNLLLNANIPQMDLVMTAERRMARAAKRKNVSTSFNTLDSHPNGSAIIAAKERDPKTSLITPPEPPFSEEERWKLKSLLANLHEENNSRCYSFFIAEEHHLDSFIAFVKSGQAVPLSYMVNVEKINEMATQTFCFNLPEMTSLTPFDRMALIQRNHHLIMCLQVRFQN